MLIPLIAAAVAQEPSPMTWAQFSRYGELSHVRETVEIASGDRKGADEFRYELRYTRIELGVVVKTARASSLDCPAIRPMIASMTTIKMPTPAPYGIPDIDSAITLDGTSYALTAPSSYSNGEITITSNLGSPLAAWVDDAFAHLKDCWRPAQSS